MIDRVTITGADDSIHPTDLIRLTEEFPFVEWGILASESCWGAGRLRYPSRGWINGLLLLTRVPHQLPLSLHVCGKWVRKLLLGEILIPPQLRHWFGRVQLNFHAEKVACNPAAFADVLRRIGRPIIFQLDGADGNAHLDSANEYEVPNCFGLFDVSGGAGVLPKQWPSPIFRDVYPGEHGEGVQQWAYHGYAGGLGPENLAEQIPLILAAAAGTEHTAEGRIWIDMETHVRSDDDRQFDLKKVRRCLEIAAPFVR